MVNNWPRFLMLLAYNLSAAYAPAALWLPDMPGSGDRGLMLLFSPVLFIQLLVQLTHPVVSWCILVLFLGMIVALTAVVSRHKVGRVTMPFCVLGYSILQGLLGSELVHGFNAIGGT
jgi:hypothetical protein